MQLPWTAPGFGQGIYPSQAEFFIPRAVDPSLIAQIARSREQQNAQLQEAIASIGQAFQQRRQDQIANQIMNQYQAPRAAPVNPGAYDPQLAASQGLDYPGTPIAPTSGGISGDSPEAYGRDYAGAGVAGPPASAPFTGGQLGLQAAMQARQLQNQDSQLGLKDALTRAQITHLTTNPSRDPYLDMIHQINFQKGMRDLNKPQDVTKTPDYMSLDAQLRSKFGAGVKEFGEVGFDVPYKEIVDPRDKEKKAMIPANPTAVQYVMPDPANPGKNKAVSNEEAMASPDSVTAIVPVPVGGGKGRTNIPIPLSEWRTIRDQYKKVTTPAQSSGGGAATGGYVPGTRYGGRLYRGGNPFDDSSWD